MYPCKPQIFNIKVGFKGVFIARTCFRDVTLLSITEKSEKSFPLRKTDTRNSYDLHEIQYCNEKVNHFEISYTLVLNEYPIRDVESFTDFVVIS